MGFKSKTAEVTLAVTVACTGFAFGISPQGVAAQAVQPDVISITFDDLGSPGHRRIFNRLGNIKSTLINKGVEVTQVFSESPLCSPSRAGLLTGQHTFNHGVVTNAHGGRLRHNETINSAFIQAGYQADFVGKYISGAGKKPPYWTHTAVMGGTNPTRFTINGKLRSFGIRWKDTVVKSLALKWLNVAPKSKPVFQQVNFVAPHVQPYSRTTGRSYVPYVMKKDRGAKQCRNISKFKPPTYTTRTNSREAYPMPNWSTGWRLKAYCESMLNVNRYVGQLVKLLKERGRPWVIILSADNGMSWGVNGFTQKHTYSASRLPVYFASSSGLGIQKGAKLSGLLSSIDIAPTIMDIAGIDFPSADGFSFLPGLKGQAFSGKSEVLQVMPTNNAQRYMAWFGLIKRDGSWLVRWADGKKLLFDWRKDPWFGKNLVKNQPKKRNEMNDRLSVLIKQSKS